MKHNLLSDSLIGVSGRSGQRQTCSLPGLFAGMARREVAGFAALRPHQRPAWHMFLVQLAALALKKANEERLPEDGETWAALLRGLTASFEQDEPWCLIVGNPERPAFLQPPDSGGLKWTPVPTADSLDVLDTAKNFDEKQAVAHDAAPEDWLYALVSLQTMAGYGGRGHYGIVRMNSGLSSRPLMGLAPGSARDTAVCPSAWWARDVRCLLSAGRAARTGARGGPALLWCLPWENGEPMRIADLDPWFIEVCRRVRLERADGRITARRSTSMNPRTDRGRFRGSLGDPWAPVEKKAQRKSLTLGRGGFTYSRLAELLFSGKWERPLLASHGPHDAGSMVLVAEAFARGKHKTEGFHARRVGVPDRSVFESPLAAECAAQQIAEIKDVAGVLRDALAVLVAGGDYRRIAGQHYEIAQKACGRLDRQADGFFFEALWKRVAACREGNDAAVSAAQGAFLEDLFRAAQVEFDWALCCLPRTSARAHRAEARARRKFRKALAEHAPAFLGPAKPDRTHAEIDAARAAADFLQPLDAGELAAMRGGRGAAAFELLASRHPNTIGRTDREDEWKAILRTLAILTPLGGSGGRAPLHDPDRRLGSVLCDGGDRDWQADGAIRARPAFSELRLTQLLAARGRPRAGKLQRAAHMLSGRMKPGGGVNVTDIAAVLLAPEDAGRIAEPYYRRLDRARAQAASRRSQGAAP